ncbi:competence protein ComS [Bacillus atrophaeus]|nr:MULTISPECIES: competence protein ComS [Bacillus]MCG8397914.1 competence protein ComS [Bacillus atrophaeus]MCM3460726.1 competence protein ComS [Bacillus atrophaeus]MCY7948840.1 competence protein ComS [Bacillus atrophaeus]MCY8097868.1 competence protein ComS [Bacillus atrophaeus]MCY8487812.1 competence protein ComS [Bacillus atrophaeus]
MNRYSKRLIKSIILYPRPSEGCISSISLDKQAQATTSLLYFCWKEK